MGPAAPRAEGLAFAAVVVLAVLHSECGGDRASVGDKWQVGTPIVTYASGPPMSEEVVREMAEAGFNVVWCLEQDLDLLQQHGMRCTVFHALLYPSTLEDPAQLAALDSAIERLRTHPALYAYYLVDEPSASAFPELGRLVGHLRDRDPAHMSYINLYPIYASNEQLGTQGDAVTAYREYLRQFLDVVKPDLVSYDHFHYMKDHDTRQYLLNLAMIREATQGAGVPFMKVVQASSWAPQVRVPNADELRLLIYTALAYGAQGISYYVYTAADHEGGIVATDGTRTRLYDAVTSLNPQFVAIATEVQPLRSLAIHQHATLNPGCELGRNLTASPAADPGFGDARMLLGYFGTQPERPTHVLVVNLDYRTRVSAALACYGDLDVFDAESRTWRATGASRIRLALPPGGGRLVRLAR